MITVREKREGFAFLISYLQEQLAKLPAGSGDEVPEAPPANAARPKGKRG